MLRRRGKRLLLAGFAVGLGVFALWQRGPRLEWYTSPPVTAKGVTTRVQLLIPSGWKADPPKTLKLTASLKSWGEVKAIELKSPPSTSLLPAWLRPWSGSESSGGYMWIWFGHDEIGSIAVVKHGPENERISYAARGLSTYPGHTIQYFHGDKDQFEATYRQICESFKVIQ